MYTSLLHLAYMPLAGRRRSITKPHGGRSAYGRASPRREGYSMNIASPKLKKR